MLPVKPIWQFLGLFVFITALLIAPWPGLDNAYATLLRAAGERLFGRFGAKGIVVFRPANEGAETHHDSKIFLGNRDMLQPGGKLDTVSVKFSARYTGFLPTALVVALVLASPIPWRRRGWALLWGFLLTNAFIAFVIFIMILHQYAESAAIGLYQMTGFPKRLLGAANEILVGYVGVYFAVPVFIWIAVAFRREDWVRFSVSGTPPEKTTL